MTMTMTAMKEAISTEDVRMILADVLQFGDRAATLDHGTRLLGNLAELVLRF